MARASDSTQEQDTSRPYYLRTDTPSQPVLAGMSTQEATIEVGGANREQARVGYDPSGHPWTEEAGNLGVEPKLRAESVKELNTARLRDPSEDEIGEGTPCGSEMDDILRTIASLTDEMEMWKTRSGALQRELTRQHTEREIDVNTIDLLRSENHMLRTALNDLPSATDDLQNTVNRDRGAKAILINPPSDGEERELLPASTDGVKSHMVSLNDTADSCQYEKDAHGNTMVGFDDDKELRVNTVETLQQENELLLHSVETLQKDNELLLHSFENLQNDNQILRDNHDNWQGQKETLMNALLGLQRVKVGLTVTIDNLRADNLLLTTTIMSLQADNDVLQLTLRDKVTEAQRYSDIAADILPLVRDQHGVALHTLVDGVLYAAGWNGEDSREEFMALNSARLRVMFGNRFSLTEISATVL
jgi:FtsZ-binding cell division protein ZapB